MLFGISAVVFEVGVHEDVGKVPGRCPGSYVGGTAGDVGRERYRALLGLAVLVPDDVAACGTRRAVIR